MQTPSGHRRCRDGAILADAVASHLYPVTEAPRIDARAETREHVKKDALKVVQTRKSTRGIKRYMARRIYRALNAHTKR